MKHKESTMTLKPAHFVVVGGGGYIGFHIGFSLWQRGHSVILFDIIQPDSFWLTRATAQLKLEEFNQFESRIFNNYYGEETHAIRFIKGSLLDVESLYKVFKNIDCVIHCASYGMSGMEQMSSEWTKTEEVNITGTENVVKACLTCGVRALVYTSSYNVVFGGQEIVNGDECLPYFPLHLHVDHYSRTKAIAERFVLFVDNSVHGESYNPISAHSQPLRTCALRMAGVFGLGEKRHLPRIVKLFPVTIVKYGYGESLQQFCTLKNVVQAHVKAAEGLLATPERLGGQAYFISDGVPMNTFKFLSPLRAALGYSPEPKLKLPMWALWFFVYMIQFLSSLCSMIHPSLRFTPFLAPAEVFKTAVTHYFSCDKAKRDFGFSPERPNDISDVIQYYFEKKRMKDKEKISTRFRRLETSFSLTPIFIVITIFAVVVAFLLLI